MLDNVWLAAPAALSAFGAKKPALEKKPRARSRFNPLRRQPNSKRTRCGPQVRRGA